jgi:hypothetical protein
MTETIITARIEVTRLVQPVEVVVVPAERYSDPVFEAYGDYDAFGPYATYEPELYPFELGEE